MKNCLIFLLAILPLAFNSTLFAQPSQFASDSTSFEIVIQEALEELNKSDHDEKTMRKYARVFYKYYLDHPNEKYSEWAIVHAFKFWGNLGDVGKVDEAISNIDYNSETWSQFIQFVPNAYHNSEGKTLEDAVDLLEELKARLTHPKSKSMASWWLANYYHGQNDAEKLTQTAREMIRLNANEIHVNQALGYLHELESLNIGQEAPRYQAETLQGKSLSLPPTDKVTILEFWATWCGPCMPEIPHLKNLRLRYSEGELQIIGISLDTNPEKLKQFIRDEEMTWPQILQPDEWSGELAKLYSVNGIPRSYIIGRDGTIIAKDLRGEELEEEIARLMN